MEQIIEFLGENMYMTAIALYIIGVFLKSIPKIPNWVIPFALAGVGILLGVLLVGVPSSSVDGYVNGVIQGILAAGAAVLVNQGYKQIKEAANKE